MHRGQEDPAGQPQAEHQTGDRQAAAGLVQLCAHVRLGDVADEFGAEDDPHQLGDHLLDVISAVW